MNDKIEKKPNKLKKYSLGLFKFLAHTMFASCIIVILVLCAFYIRILWKPINLEFLQPFLEKIISDDVYKIDIVNPRTTNHYSAGLFGVHVDEIIITNRDNHEENILKNITLDISKIGLIRQELAFNSIKIDEISLKLGNIDFLFDKKTVNTSNSTDDTDFGQKLSEYFQISYLKPLTNIHIKKLDVQTIFNQKSNLKISTRNIEFKRIHHFFNHHDKYQLKFNIKTKSDDFKQYNIQKAYFDFSYNPETLETDLNFNDIVTNFGNITRANFNINQSYDFQFNAIVDNIHDGYFYQTPTDLKHIQTTGRFDKNSQLLKINQFQIDFDNGLLIDGNAETDFNDGFDIFSYNLNANIHYLTFPTFLKLWSPKLAGGAKEWVEYSMTQAHFATAHLNVSGISDQDFPQQLSLNAPITQASFSYLKPMQPATNVNGRLLIDNKTFIAQVDNGQIDVLNVKQAFFKIPDIVADVPQAQVSADIQGQLKPLLTIINSKPLELMKKGGFNHHNSVGIFDGNLTMNFALVKGLKLSDIEMASNTKVTNGSLIVGKKPLPLEKINGNFHITPHKGNGTGTVRFHGMDSEFEWAENFNLAADVTTDLKLKASLNDKNIQKLFDEFTTANIAVIDYLQGNASVRSHIQFQNDRIKSMIIDADLTQANLGQTDNIWRFPKNSSKTLNFSAEQKDEGFYIHKLNIDNKKNKIYLSDIIIANGYINSIKVNHFNFKNIIKNLHGDYSLKDNRHFTNFSANTIFLTPIIDSLMKKTDNPSIKTAEYPNMHNDLKIKNFKATENILINDADIILSRDMTDKHKLFADLSAPNLDVTKIKIQETAPQARLITVKTDNAGRFMNAMGIAENFRNGILNLTMTQHNGITKGNAYIKNGMILKSPWIAKLLSLASLSGIVDRLNSRGLSVEKTKIEFSKIDNVIYLKNGLMNGSAIGISFQGERNFQHGNVNIYGTVIPFYGLNSALSDIPIIGQITSSRKNEGVMGLSYKIQGKVENPEISVSPLSILTIGIFRRIFEN